MTSLQKQPSGKSLEEQALSRRRFLGAVGLTAGAVPGLLVPGLGHTQSQPSQRTATSTKSPPKVEYQFKIEDRELAPFGVPGKATLVNGSFPGPEIRVKEGDLLRVTVANALTQPTTIHWHGLLVPDPMDGVPDVSQAPIPPNEFFVYEYPIQQAGTYWYHSHYQLQEAIGLAGPYIIEPKRETLKYDQDCTVFLSAWTNENPYGIVPGLRKGVAPPAPAAATLNNLPDGTKFNVDVSYTGYMINGKTNASPWTCKAKPGERVRLRIINGSASTFYRIVIDDHRMTVTHADGLPVRPVEVDNLIIGTAERYDVLVTMGKSGSYTFRAAALGQQGEALGVLHTPDVKPVVRKGRPQWGPRILDYKELFAATPTTLRDGPLKTFRLALGGNMGKYLWSINGQYFPEIYSPDGKADPLLINPGDRVRIELVNETVMYHPMHLHGHFFRLLARSGPDPRAPLKDTVISAPRTTTTIEFFADNPGRWFFHCHNLFHMVAGMARVWRYVI